MLVTLRKEYGQLITSGSQLTLLALGAGSGSPAGWSIALALTAALSVVAWASAYRRSRALADTPTSRIATAAQGYTEILGTGRPLGGAAVMSPLTNLPCLWYRYRVERRDDNKWHHHESGESDASFVIADASGECLVDPEGAEILTPQPDTWTKGDYRYTQWLLLANDTLYALGDFVTRGRVDLQSSQADDVRLLLAEWKKDMPRLLQRFDLDGSGELSLAEWQLARRQARREISAAQRQTQASMEVHLMRRPPDGRLYLISGLSPEALDRRYRRWTAFHLIVFFGALGGLAAALNEFA